MFKSSWTHPTCGSSTSTAFPTPNQLQSHEARSGKLPFGMMLIQHPMRAFRLVLLHNKPDLVSLLAMAKILSKHKKLGFMDWKQNMGYVQEQTHVVCFFNLPVMYHHWVNVWFSDTSSTLSPSPYIKQMMSAFLGKQIKKHCDMLYPFWLIHNTGCQASCQGTHLFAVFVLCLKMTVVTSVYTQSKDTQSTFNF